MKTCSRCKEQKPLSEFRNRKASKDGKGSACKPCMCTSDNAHYARNPERRKRIRESNDRRMWAAREFLLDVFSKNPCTECGERDPVVLDFDHQDGKIANVSHMVTNGYSLATIKKEIEKCVVRCSNCHRRKTSKQFGWWYERV